MLRDHEIFSLDVAESLWRSDSGQDVLRVHLILNDKHDMHLQAIRVIEDAHGNLRTADPEYAHHLKAYRLLNGTDNPRRTRIRGGEYVVFAYSYSN